MATDSGGQEQAPQGVRLVVDGVEYPCDVLRDPELDAGGLATWVVVPAGPLPAVRETLAVRAAMIPGRVTLVVDFTRKIGESR
jgi:hypothetical protein